MADKQKQVKQVWFNPQDEENFRIVAQKLQAQGIDVEPDNRRANEPYSHTKVIRYILAQAATDD